MRKILGLLVVSVLLISGLVACSSTDSADNEVNLYQEKSTDVTEIFLEIDSPPDETVFYEKDIIVSGKTVPGADVTVCGVPVYVNVNGEFSVAKSLGFGANIIRIVADADNAEVVEYRTLAYSP